MWRHITHRASLAPSDSTLHTYLEDCGGWTTLARQPTHSDSVVSVVERPPVVAAEHLDKPEVEHRKVLLLWSR